MSVLKLPLKPPVDPTKAKHYKLKLLKAVYCSPEEGAFAMRFPNCRISLYHKKKDLKIELVIQFLSNELAENFLFHGNKLILEYSLFRTFKVNYHQVTVTASERYFFAFLTAMQIALTQNVFVNPKRYD